MRLLLLILVISFFSGAAGAQMLQGGVQQWAQPGAEWHQPESTNENWFAIPAWLSGSWHYEGIGQFRDANFRERIGPETAHYDLVWGTQQDKLNDVWQLDVVPHTDHVVKTDCEQNVVNLGREPLSGDSASFRYVKRAICVTVVNGRVTASTPIDAEIRLLKTGKNSLIQQNDVIRPDGVHEYSMLRATRKEPFVPVDRDSNGRDLRRAFADYLFTHNMPGRVPVQL